MASRKKNPPPRIYPVRDMPRVDVHVHVRNIEDGTQMLRKMNAGVLP